MTTSVDQATMLLQTPNTASKTKLRAAPVEANFAQHIIRVNEGASPATYARLIDPRGAEFLLKETERTAQYEAQREVMLEFWDKSSFKAEQMGAALAQMRQLFADSGVPIIDMAQIMRSPDGTYHVRGWGKGESVSHPQAKFLEAILNGKDPGFEELSKKIAASIEDIEKLFAQMQGLREEYQPLVGGVNLGYDGQHFDSIFDTHFVLATEHTGQVQGEARKLSMRDPEHFQAFKDSLGDELGKLSSEQLLSRYHFDTVMLPKLQKALPDYFA